MRRILLVDEPNILEGLQRMLRLMRQEWQMAYANYGPQALALLDSNLCDLRMPGMVLSCWRRVSRLDPTLQYASWPFGPHLLGVQSRQTAEFLFK